MTYRAQFWIRHVGRANIIVNAAAGTALQLAEQAVVDALIVLNRKWPGNHRSDLHLVGMEPLP